MEERMEGVTLLQQGHRYAFGRGADFYGIWRTTSSPFEFVERFPLDGESWHQARRRFEALELQPDGAPVSTSTRVGIDRLVLGSAGMIVIGVVLGIVALFPRYLGNLSIVSQGDQLLPHIFYLVGWATVVMTLVASDRYAHAGALFGVALSAMTFGFYLSDLGTAIAGVSNTGGVGLYLGIIGWIFCAAGCVGALFRLQAAIGIAKPNARRLPLLVVASIFAIGTAITFIPSWDRYTLFSVATGQTQNITAGYAFSNPGIVIAADMVIVVVLVALVVLALTWRQLLFGAALVAGALIPHIAQIFSALIQNATPPSSASFGISPAEAAQAQLQITASLTPWFYLYCTCVGLLVATAMMMSREKTSRD